jgi:hypothetical protein
VYFGGSTKEVDMSLCPICGEWRCNHTQAERGQSFSEAARALLPEEYAAFMDRSSGGNQRRIEVAKKYAHCTPWYSPLPKLEGTIKEYYLKRLETLRNGTNTQPSVDAWIIRTDLPRKYEDVLATLGTTEEELASFEKRR